MQQDDYVRMNYDTGYYAEWDPETQQWVEKEPPEIIQKARKRMLDKVMEKTDAPKT